MKKNIYALLAFCLFTTLVNAQKITEKDLQGQWDIATVDLGEVVLDVINNDVILDDEIKSKLTPETLAGLKEGMAATIDIFKGSYIKVSGNKLTMMLDQEDTGAFVIKEVAGKHILSITYDDASAPADEYEILLKGKELHILSEEEGEMLDFVYVKK